MATNYTTLLGLAQPTTGELAGTWGDTVNNYITTYLDAAVADAQVIGGTNTTITLSKTTGASLTQVGTGTTGSSQYQILRLNGTPASAVTVLVPNAYKTYIVINTCGKTVTIKGVTGPTTGVSVVNGAYAVVAWNGSDFVIATAASDGAGGAVVNAVNGGQLAGFRNKIINGKMEIVQRGVAFTAGPGSTSGFCQDRWINATSTGTTGAFTTSGPADAPAAAPEFTTSLRATVGTADTSMAAGDLYVVQQRIEGYNVRDLVGKTFTLSFWVRSSKTGTHCISFGNNADRSYVVEYTVSAVNTWEFKTITVSGGLITAGTWNWTNGQGLVVSFALAVGSGGQGVAGSWITTGYAYATANQVNVLDTVGNIFAITGVQLEVGSVATPFEQRPIGTELALCQRYYENGFSFGSVAPAGISPVITQQYLVEKRATPSLSVTPNTSITVSAAGTTYYSSSGFDYSPDTRKFVLYNAAATAVGASWTSSAEL